MIRDGMPPVCRFIPITLVDHPCLEADLVMTSIVHAGIGLDLSELPKN
jgi:hypothetical protein